MTDTFRLFVLVVAHQPPLISSGLILRVEISIDFCYLLAHWDSVSFENGMSTVEMFVCHCI